MAYLAYQFVGMPPPHWVVVVVHSWAVVVGLATVVVEVLQECSVLVVLSLLLLAWSVELVLAVVD